MKKIIRLTESDIAKIVKKKIDALKPVVDDITDKYGDRRFKQIEGGQFKPSKKFKKQIQSMLKPGIKESKVLKENTDEFEYDDSVDLGRGRHQQAIYYKGEFIGYVIYTEKHPFVPFEETYVIPDVEKGLSEPDRYQHLRWVELTYFDNYDDAFHYVQQNFDDVVYLANNGSWD